MALGKAGDVVGGISTSGKSFCAQRFAYDWDEIGQLIRARRWDYDRDQFGRIQFLPHRREHRIGIGECLLVEQQDVAVADGDHVVVKHAGVDRARRLLCKDDARWVEPMSPRDRLGRFACLPRGITLRQGRGREAIPALEAEPREPEALPALGCAYARTGRPQEASATVEI